MRSTVREVLLLLLIVPLLLGMGRLAGSVHGGSSGVVVDADRLEIRGSVTASDGTPLSGAMVQARHAEATLAAGTTDRSGAFRLILRTATLTADEVADVVLRVERLGYRPVERRLGSAAESEHRIVLTPAPLPLPGLEVDLGPVRCEAEDPAGAGRALWEAAAARHPGGLDTVGVASYMTARTDTLLVFDRVATRDEVGITGDPGQRGSAPTLRLGWNRRIERQGYAFPVRRTDRSGSHASWSYAPLEADLAPHFGSEQFGRRHYLQLLTERADGWTVRFCARDTRHPHLEGRLELSADTLISRAEWRFVTPEPDEGAGGWAVFPPAGSSGEPPVLLPVESLAWHSIRGERTIRRAQWFEEWIVAPGDSVPFLPRRARGERAPRR